MFPRKRELLARRMGIGLYTWLILIRAHISITMADPALLQLQVRQNSEDLQDYLRELGNWEDEIKKKDAMLYKQKPVLKKVNHGEPSGHGWCCQF